MTKSGIMLVSVAALMLVVLWWTVRLAPARSAAAHAISQERQVAKDLARLALLRTRESQVAAQRLPDHDLVTRMQHTLSLAGLSGSAFLGVQPLGEQVNPGSRLRVRRVQVRLGGVTAAQIGAWMSAWVVPDQPWSIEGIELVHLDGAPGMSGREFSVSIALVARSIDGG